LGEPSSHRRLRRPQTRRRYFARNPVALAKPPRVEDAEVDPFEAEKIERILTLALRKRNGVRFVIALALGLRQGEALGLKWSRLHEPSKTLEIMRLAAADPANTEWQRDLSVVQQKIDNLGKSVEVA